MDGYAFSAASHRLNRRHWRRFYRTINNVLLYTAGWTTSAPLVGTSPPPTPPASPPTWTPALAPYPPPPLSPYSAARCAKSTHRVGHSRKSLITAAKNMMHSFSRAAITRHYCKWRKTSGGRDTLGYRRTRKSSSSCLHALAKHVH
jgi:hypothetical protein